MRWRDLRVLSTSRRADAQSMRAGQDAPQSIDIQRMASPYRPPQQVRQPSVSNTCVLWIGHNWVVPRMLSFRLSLGTRYFT